MKRRQPVDVEANDRRYCGAGGEGGVEHGCDRQENDSAATAVRP